MFNEVIYGMPKRCINRNCKAPFNRESHLGVMPLSEIDVKVVMRCPKCRYTFEVHQALSMVFDYLQLLPENEQAAARRTNPITNKEHERMLRSLDDAGALSRVFEGLRPGAAEIRTRED